MKAHLRLPRALRSDRDFAVSIQIWLALACIGSLFIPSRQYPLLVSLSEAEIRVQDLLLFGFVSAVILGSRASRDAVKGAMLTWPAICAAVFVILVVLSLGQVPAPEFASSAVAVGKLIEFSIVGAVAGVVLMSAGRFPAFVAVLGLGAAVNAAISVWRGVKEAANLDGFVDARPDGFLGPDVLATGGAVAAIGGLALTAGARKDRPLAIGVMAAGGLAILAGRSILAAGAFLVGLATLALILRRRSTSVAILVSLALLAVVLASRQRDVMGVTRLLDAPASATVRDAPKLFLPAANHLLNGGCESDIEGWSTNGQNVAVGVDRDQRRFGVASCKVRTPGVTPGEGVFHHDVNVLAAATYSLSAWIRAPRGASLSLGIEWLGTERQFLSGSATRLNGDGLWRLVAITRTSPRNVGSARPTIYSNERGKSLVFGLDGIQLQQGKPTPYGVGSGEPPSNVIVNDGCEASTTGWNANPFGVNVARTLDRPKVGEGACAVTTPGTSNGEGVFHEKIAVSDQLLYEFSSWIRAPAGVRMALRIEWLGEKGQVLSVTSGSFMGDGKWSLERLVDVPAPRASVSARPTIYTAERQGVTFYVDGTFFATWSSISDASYARGSVSHRVLVSYIGARVAADHPITGVGWLQGSTQRFMANPAYERSARRLLPAIDPTLYPSRYPTHSHSAYIQTAADAGVAALFALLAMTIAAVLRTVRATRRTEGERRAYLGAVAAMIVAIAFWFNSTPLFGGSLEVGLFWCLVGMAASIHAGRTSATEAGMPGKPTG